MSDPPPPGGGDPPLPEGGRIGPYRLLSVLGQGGMGTVYLAQQEEGVRRRVALKIIKLGMDTRDVVARFEAERQALALMDHPGIARVHEAGATASGRPYFVMELVTGEPITNYCDRQRLGTRERLELVIKVCAAVQHAHHKGIIHRDLKPSNVLVSDQGEDPVVKVIDFGVAKATSQRLTEKTLFTERGVMIGTPEYMSPEQAEMGVLDVDTRTDVYSLGVLLYELLVGERPFDRGALRGQGYAEIQRIIREVEPPRPSTRLGTRTDATTEHARRRSTNVSHLHRQIRGDLDWVTMKAMEKNRLRRYGTPSELAGDLRRYLEDEPVSAGPPSAVYRMRKMVRRYRVPLAVVTLLFAVLGASLVAITNMYWTSREARMHAESEVEKFRALSEFFTSVIQSPDPIREGGPDTRVLDVLTNSVERIDDSFREKPEISVPLRRTMGTTLMNLGAFQEAEVQLARGLEESRTAFGDTDHRTVFLRSRLGELHFQQGRYDDAERQFRRAVDALESVDEPDLDLLVHSLSGLQVVLKSQNRLAESEVLLRRTIEIQETRDPDSWELQQLYQNLARLLQAQGEREDALLYFERSLEGCIRIHTEESVYTSIFQRNLAWLLRELDRHEEAIELCRRALEISRRTMPERHPITLTAWNHLAGILADAGRSEEAVREYEALVAIATEVLPPDDISFLIYRKDYGGCLLDLGRYDEAESQLVPAAAGLEELNGVENPATQNAVAKLVQLYERWSEESQDPDHTESLRRWREKLRE